MLNEAAGVAIIHSFPCSEVQKNIKDVDWFRVLLVGSETKGRGCGRRGGEARRAEGSTLCQPCVYRPHPKEKKKDATRLPRFAPLARFFLLFFALPFLASFLYTTQPPLLPTCSPRPPPPLLPPPPPPRRPPQQPPRAPRRETGRRWRPSTRPAVGPRGSAGPVVMQFRRFGRVRVFVCARMD